MRLLPVRTARAVAAAAVAVLTAAGLSGCGFHGLYGAPLPGGADLGSHPFEVTGYFQDVLDLVPNSQVKVNDVAVGKVTAIALVGWRAKVTMEVNGSVSLPRNSRAEIEQTSLLGEKYVALMPPLGVDARARLVNDDVIPYAATTSAPEVEEVLGALSLLLNGGGLTQIQTIATELNRALHGNEGRIRDLLGQLNTFVGTLDGQKDEITKAIDDLDTLSATLNRQKQVLVDALASYPAAIRVLAGQRKNLVTLLTSLSHLGDVAGGVIDATQTNLVSSLKRLAPVLQSLTAAGDALPRSLRILLTFPFTVGNATQFARGDYANLALYLNLDLQDSLCGLNKALCTAGRPAANSSANSASSHRLHGSSLAPMIVGSGR